MSAIDNKYHLKIGGIGVLLAKGARTNRHTYSREEAPAFVNKFGSGDPNYRDGSFFGHWAQLDWLNGFDQEYFEDPGRFYRSENIDTTESTKAMLETQLQTAGQLASGVKVNCFVTLPSDASWADNNYDYRKQITITAPAGAALWYNMAVKLEEDQDALETAGKLQADRDDWKIYYFNGSSWTELKRDVKGDTETWFKIQDKIDAGNSDNNYYVYYGYSSETANSQPTTDSEWNEVYGRPEDTADTILLCHFEELDTGAVQDRSGNGNDGTISGGASLVSGGKQGDAIDLEASSNQYVDFGNDASLQVTDSFNIQMWIKPESIGSLQRVINKSDFSTDRSFEINITAGGKLQFIISDDGSTTYTATGSTTLSAGTMYHVGVTYSAGSGIYIYLDNVSDGSNTTSIPASINNSSENLKLGYSSSSFDGLVDGLSIETVVKTLFKYGEMTGSPTVSTGSEVVRGAASSIGGSVVLAGCSDGKIYKSGDLVTWTEAKNTSNSSVNCAKIVEIGGSTYAVFGSGDPTSNTDGTAKIHHTTNGTSFTDITAFSGGTTSAVLSLEVFNATVYAGTGPHAEIWSSTDLSTWTQNKDINEPNNPGHVWTMAVYNNQLFAAGGHPEEFITDNSHGFLWRYDGYEWKLIYDFTFTVVKSMYVYDSLLFMGTIHGQIYVFNTASIDKLVEFPFDVSIQAMTTFDDKLAIAIASTDSANPTGNEAVYLFDRNGFHHAFENSNANGYYALINVSNRLVIGTGDSGYALKTVPNTYADSGFIQSSYNEAQLPSIDKLYREVTILFDALPQGTSIEVQYRTDESASWTSLGTSDTQDATSETFTFSSSVYGKKLSLKYILSSNDDNSDTPVLRKVIVKYVLAPDFKYLWRFNAVCADQIIWMDDTEPVAVFSSAISAAQTTLDLVDASGFPDPNGDTLYATIVDSDGNEDRFTYTGKSGNQLTGIPSSGDYALSSHGASEISTASYPSQVVIRGRDLHKSILDMKQTKQFYTLTDIDGNTYTVFFHSYSTDGWAIDPRQNAQDAGVGLFENEVPITLLEA